MRTADFPVIFIVHMFINWRFYGDIYLASDRKRFVSVMLPPPTWGKTSPPRQTDRHLQLRAVRIFGIFSGFRLSVTTITSMVVPV